jgi:AsmA protein
VNGAVNSNGHTLEMTGKMTAEKVKLTRDGATARNPLLFDVALSEDLRRHAGQMKRGDIRTGPVAASLTATWSSQRDSTIFNMTLAAPNVPVSGFQELLPVLGIVLPSGAALEGGTAAATLTITGPASAMVIAGPVRIGNATLKGFDLAARMSQITTLAGIKSGPATAIQLLSANVRIAPEGTSLQDIHVVLPAIGELTGGGTISPNHMLAFKMRAVVRPGLLASTLAPSAIGFFVEGSASDPRFRPDVGQLASEEINQRLKGVKVGGVDGGQAADSVLRGLLGPKKKK